MIETILFKTGDGPDELSVTLDEHGSFRTVGDTRKIACRVAVELHNTIIAVAKLREELRLLRSQAEQQAHTFHEQGHHLLSDCERYKIQAIDEMQSKFEEEFSDV